MLSNGVCKRCPHETSQYIAATHNPERSLFHVISLYISSHETPQEFMKQFPEIHRIPLEIPLEITLEHPHYSPVKNPIRIPLEIHFQTH